MLEVSNAHVCASPVAIEVTFEVERACTGVEIMVQTPLTSVVTPESLFVLSPSCPFELEPQQKTLPEVFMPQLCEEPRDKLTMFDKPVTVTGMLLK